MWAPQHAAEAQYNGVMARKLRSSRESAIERGKRWAKHARHGEFGGYGPLLSLAFLAVVVMSIGLSMTFQGADWGPELAILALVGLGFIGWRVYVTWHEQRERRERTAELRRRREAE